MRPSLGDIEAFIAPFRSLPEEQRQTHFHMPIIADEAEVNTFLSMLASESSDSARTESMTTTTGHGLGEDEGIQSHGSIRRKRSRRTSHPAAPAERKKRKKRLRRSSGLELDADPTTSLLGGGPARPTSRTSSEVVMISELVVVCLMRMKRRRKRSP